MNGDNLFVDTNILLYLLSGDETLSSFLSDKQLYISFITQLELLGYKGIKKENQSLIEDLLSHCKIIDINTNIKSEVIKIRRKYKIKLPDCIIIATSIYLNIPIITADKDFKKIEDLTLILYEK